MWIFKKKKYRQERAGVFIFCDECMASIGMIGLGINYFLMRDTKILYDRFRGTKPRLEGFLGVKFIV